MEDFLVYFFIYFHIKFFLYTISLMFISSLSVRRAHIFFSGIDVLYSLVESEMRPHCFYVSSIVFILFYLYRLRSKVKLPRSLLLPFCVCKTQ